MTSQPATATATAVMFSGTRKHPSATDATPPKAKARMIDSSQSILEKLDQLSSQQQKFREEQRGLRDSLEKRLGDMESKLKDICQNVVKELVDEFQLELAQVSNRLAEMEGQVTDRGKAMREDIITLKSRVERVEENTVRRTEFSPDVSVVCYGLGYEVEEDLDQKVRRLLKDGLKLDICYQAVERTPQVNDKPGVVKIELKSIQDKIKVLRNKSKLSDGGYRRVYLRSAQTHAERVLHHNTQLLLKELGVDGKYRASGNGKLITRNDNNGSSDGRGDRRDGIDQDGYETVGRWGGAGHRGRGRGGQGGDARGGGHGGNQGQGRFTRGGSQTQRD